MITSIESHVSRTPGESARRPWTSSWNSPSSMRAVCSARASERPIQYSSWAMRASIAVSCCCCCCWEDQPPWRSRSGSGGGDQAWSGSTPASAGGGSSSSTQVSFEPPPCEELTIIEPSRSATRVRPPGTMWMSSPNTANGRRSTCRDASRPSSIAVGQVESCTSSWAIQRAGAASTSRRWRSSSCSVAVGPMNTPLPPDSLVGLTTSSDRRESTYSRCSGSSSM